MSTHIWLRSETKPAEKRTALTPSQAGRLIDAGFRLTVEKSSQSVFPWTLYESTGCEIADEHSWVTAAPADAIILGLKELASSDAPLVHRHIHFAHVYKRQAGWEKFLARFLAGGGCLYDLEFLVDEQGRRVAAFGYWAGFAGAALGLLAWAGHATHQQPVLNAIHARPNQQVLVHDVREAIAKTGRRPVVLVIGALGRCGRGAVELCEAVGADVIRWDLEETQKGGPFEEILGVDVFLNCVFIGKSVPPFLTKEMLQTDTRHLSVVCDISCDPYGDDNPIPIYSQCTTFGEPVEALLPEPHPLYLIAIDHLPSLLPRESSEDYCEQLITHLLGLNDLEQGVWKRAHDLFCEKMSLIQTG